MIKYQFFPRSRGVTNEIQKVIECFKAVESDIDSATNNLVSNEVLAKVRPYLEQQSYKVEIGKSTEQKIDVPVLFGRDNAIDKSFYADALSEDGRIVIEVEAGQTTENNKFLKDIFEACMMFDVEYLVLARAFHLHVHRPAAVVGMKLEVGLLVVYHELHIAVGVVGKEV